VHSRPYRPEGRGKIERFFKTLRLQLLSLIPEGGSLNSLNSKLQEWIEEDYHQRVHSSTKETPLSRYLKHIHLIRETPEDMEDYFRRRTTRRVHKDRTVFLNGRLFEAPVGLIGKIVTLLYHDHDPLPCGSRSSWIASLKAFWCRSIYTSTAVSAERIPQLNSSPRTRKNNLMRLQVITETDSSSEGKTTMTNYRSYFGFSREPFAQDIPTDKLFPTPGLKSTSERCLFAIHLGAVCVITGEVGAGKSTTLRYISSKLHPSSHRLIPVIASTGSTLEVLRQICSALDADSRSNSIAKITKTIRTLILETAQRKQNPVLMIDEANLLRLEVLAQLQTLGQFDHDSKPILPIILTGQSNLLDKLMYHTSRPIASRVVARSHLEGLDHTQMAGYLKHHQEIAGVKNQLFADEAILAIHQGSGGLLRRANNLARGALIAATKEKSQIVSAEHVRVASTEII